jgi:hypothetical protein
VCSRGGSKKKILLKIKIENGIELFFSLCERRVNLLVCSLPLHRHSYIGFILAFASSIHNKQFNQPTVALCFSHLDVSHANLFRKWFRQIIKMNIRYTILPGKNHISILQSLPDTLSSPGPKTQVFPHLFTRTEEEVLGVSFNVQSQSPDIPLISTRNALSIYTGSFNSQSRVPDISQDQSPDDPCYE